MYFHVDNGLKIVPQTQGCLSHSISPSLKANSMGRTRSQRRFHSIGVHFDKLEHTFGKHTKILVWHAGRIRKTTSEMLRVSMLWYCSLIVETLSLTLRNVVGKENNYLWRCRQLTSSKFLPTPNLQILYSGHGVLIL